MNIFVGAIANGLTLRFTAQTPRIDFTWKASKTFVRRLLQMRDFPKNLPAFKVNLNGFLSTIGPFGWAWGLLYSSSKFFGIISSGRGFPKSDFVGCFRVDFPEQNRTCKKCKLNLDSLSAIITYGLSENAAIHTTRVAHHDAGMMFFRFDRWILGVDSIFLEVFTENHSNLFVSTAARNQTSGWMAIMLWMARRHLDVKMRQVAQIISSF